jgi:hypothetical protein
MEGVGKQPHSPDGEWQQRMAWTGGTNGITEFSKLTELVEGVGKPASFSQ